MYGMSSARRARASGLSIVTATLPVAALASRRMPSRVPCADTAAATRRARRAARAFSGTAARRPSGSSSVPTLIESGSGPRGALNEREKAFASSPARRTSSASTTPVRSRRARNGTTLSRRAPIPPMTSSAAKARRASAVDVTRRVSCVRVSS
ncbi:hypothetical protein B5808_13610 [Cnuibacter physcomitrellae]|uniref:Uncharacterized protein n=1 Tax=Cnuibacter physcomitrellae TaxID=1619308 RepID=A0A1X9LNW6_9MICO|nr:hypothetical protein B5808_13610 [Cnuibacter physcomitrellae]